MHDARVTRPAISDAAARARCGNTDDLAAALCASRADTLATFEAYERALPDLAVPQRPELNPPLWELGHVGWFQTWWVGRNPTPERARGHRADPEVPRRAAGTADSWYDSSRVPHAARWSLPLPDARQTRTELAAQLDETLALLSRAEAGVESGAAARDDALYFYRLALLHEDMHHEAALYMAQSLDIAIDDPRWQPAPLHAARAELSFDTASWRLGSAASGFAFDNELQVHELPVAAYRIDAQPLRWVDYLPFVEDGGYARAAAWTERGWRWRQEQRLDAPRYLRREGGTGSIGGTWLRRRYGHWEPLNLREAACHLSLFEAEAWCRWAGRRLPSEAEWERAACTRPEAFDWDQVWEWTASAFEPFPGFAAHPYRDYSAPWFDGRPVLRGASFMTQPRMRHPRYRNFFPPWRNDVPAGFRSCPLQ